MIALPSWPLVALGLACTAITGAHATDSIRSAPEPPAPASASVPLIPPAIEQTAGLDRLTAEQRAALEAQLARELRLAREGDLRGFAGTFFSRRSTAERAAAGLDALSTEERAALDRFVADRLASPAVDLSAGALPPPTPRYVGVRTLRREPELHGHVSFTYGWGGDDRTVKAGSMAVTYVDPEHGFAATIGYSTYDFDGDWGAPGRHAPLRRHR